MNFVGFKGVFVDWWLWTFKVFRRWWWLAVLVKVVEVVVIFIIFGKLFSIGYSFVVGG